VLFPGIFTSDHSTWANALVSRRNAELHTGQSAFDEYTTQQWVAGLYSCCKALTEALGESLESLLGKDEAAEANTVLAGAASEVKGKVHERIARYKAVFGDKPEGERTAALASAEAEADRLAHARHHRVKCPACSAKATLQGDTLGDSKVEDNDGEIIVKQAVAPRKFNCTACGLKLEGYAELAAASLGDQYTRTTRYSPEEYYELIDPSDRAEVERIARENLGMYHPDDREYDNE
jgi:hypothetical protein